jgi:saccharopine dehydrogenase-like NADP-dependent oxidoreductase
MVFPEPVGEVEDVYHCIHSEIATLPLTYKEKGIKKVNFKQSIGENLTEPIKVMIKIGLTGREPIDVKGEKVTPIDLLYRCVENLPPPTGPVVGGEAVTIVGEHNGEKVEVILQALYTPDTPPPRYDSTGVAASIIGQMLARGEIRTKGVLAPEVAVNPKRYLDELAKRNIRYDVILKRSAK